MIKPIEARKLVALPVSIEELAEWRPRVDTAIANAAKQGSKETRFTFGPNVKLFNAIMKDLTEAKFKVEYRERNEKGEQINELLVSW